MKLKNDKASLCIRKLSRRKQSLPVLYIPLQKKGSNSKDSSELPVNVLSGSTVSGLDLNGRADWSLSLGLNDRSGLDSGADSALWSNKDGGGGVRSWLSSDSGNVSKNWSNGLSRRGEGSTCLGHHRLADLIANGGNESVNNSWSCLIQRNVSSGLGSLLVDRAEGLAGNITDGSSNSGWDHVSQ